MLSFGLLLVYMVDVYCDVPGIPPRWSGMCQYGFHVFGYEFRVLTDEVLQVRQLGFDLVAFPELFGSSQTLGNGVLGGEGLYVCQIFLYLFAQFQVNGW